MHSSMHVHSPCHLTQVLLEGNLASMLDALVAMQTVGYLQLLIGLLAVIIAVTAIARAGIVPSPWNWAPTWALVALAVPQILVQAIAAANPADLQQAAQWISLLGVIVAVSAPILLGVIAIALAQRPAHREPTPILDSRD